MQILSIYPVIPSSIDVCYAKYGWRFRNRFANRRLSHTVVQSRNQITEHRTHNSKILLLDLAQSMAQVSKGRFFVLCDGIKVHVTTHCSTWPQPFSKRIKPWRENRNKGLCESLQSGRQRWIDRAIVDIVFPGVSSNRCLILVVWSTCCTFTFFYNICATYVIEGRV